MASLTTLKENIGTALKGTGGWCTGLNNGSAIGQVVRGLYTYNGDDETKPGIKIRQIGTEILHIGLKWSTALFIGDHMLLKFKLIEKPVEGSLRSLAHIVAEKSGKAVSDLLSLDMAKHGASAAGLLSLGYATRQALKSGYKTIKQAKVLLNPNSTIADIGICANHGLTTLASTLVFKSYLDYGLEAAALAGFTLLVANHSGKVGKTALKLGGIYGIYIFQSMLTKYLYSRY